MNLNLPHIPKRDAKPRESGITMVMDKGLSLREAEDLVSSSSELIDFIKFGFGTSYITINLKEKLKIYADAGIKTYLGGTLFEAFIIRNMFDDFRRMVEEYKLEVVEVSDGSIILPHDEKLEYIRKLSKQVMVLSEVGSKEEGILISPSKWVSMMATELEAGSWKVIAEGRESGTVGIFRPNGEPHRVLINKIMAKVKKEDIIWEAPQKRQRVWFIKLMGSDVNLGNIAPNDVIPLETLRLGLRGDTFFEFLPDDLKQ